MHTLCCFQSRRNTNAILQFGSDEKVSYLRAAGNFDTCDFSKLCEEFFYFFLEETMRKMPQVYHSSSDFLLFLWSSIFNCFLVLQMKTR